MKLIGRMLSGTAAVMAATILLLSCSNNALPGPVATGKVVVNLVSPAGRGLTNSDAAAMADSYEIVAFTPGDTTDTMYHATVNFGIPTELALPVGAGYTVVALAGKNLSTGGTTTKDTVILGSGRATGVEVKSGAVTDVSLILSCVSVNFTGPDAVACGKQIAIKYEIGFSIPELVLQYPPTVSLANHTPVAATYNGYTNDSQTGVQTSSFVATAQATAASVSATVSGGTPSVTVSHNRDCNSYYGFSYNWQLPGTATLPELKKNFPVYLSTITEGVTVTIGWAP